MSAGSKATQLDSIAVPAIGAATPGILARAQETAVRVLVRNTGVSALFISTTTENLVNPGGPSTASFRLVAGAENVFVLAPKQRLYAIALGLGNQASVAISEALPMERY
jgi:hypothetical protein